MTTRAVHIEIVPSMNTSSCALGIERFIARRGTPSVIWSDNGNFVGAEKELLNCIQSWHGQAPPELAKKGIKWKFNPRQPCILVVLGNVSFGVVKGYSTQ